MAKKSLRERLGDPPVDDSLAAISWMQRALAAMAGDVLDSNLKADEKRDEMLKIADRMAKLRDPDRIYRAEQVVKGSREQQEDTQPGPAVTDAPDFSQPDRQQPARRGRPPKRSLR